MLLQILEDEQVSRKGRGRSGSSLKLKFEGIPSMHVQPVTSTYRCLVWTHARKRRSSWLPAGRSKGAAEAEARLGSGRGAAVCDVSSRDRCFEELRVPAGPVTARMAASTASSLGEANTSPHTAAASMPRPTNPAMAGS